MFQVKRNRPECFEDLMREMGQIEEQLMSENSALAMNMMVLEAKIRERFQLLEKRFWDDLKIPADAFELEDELTEDQIQALIPRDIPLPASFKEITDIRKRKKILQTVGLAGLLAVLTAGGVFTLASILQFALNFIS